MIDEFKIPKYRVSWKEVKLDATRRADWFSEPIKGAACVGVVLFTGEVGHRESGQVKDQVGRSNKPFAERKSSSRAGLVEALIELSGKINALYSADL